MKQSNIVIIIYIIEIIGALLLDIWRADTSIKKSLTSLGWTTIFYSDRKKKYNFFFYD